MLNNVRITASTLVPLSLALCISWWHCRARCFTQRCVTLVVTLEHQRALCRWQTALCTTHVAWCYITRGLHQRILAAHALFLSVSFKPSVCFSKVFFKAMGARVQNPPCIKEGDLHHHDQSCIIGSTPCCADETCWVPGGSCPLWCLLQLEAEAQPRGMVRAGNWRCSEPGKKEFQWWYSHSRHLNPVMGHTEDFLPEWIRLLRYVIKWHRSIIILLSFVVAVLLPFSEQGSGFIHCWCDCA